MGNEKKLGSISLFALWFGAAISLAEILTGGLLAPLGIRKGALVILAGHLVGCLILATVGMIGFREKRPSLLSSRISFGKYGSFIISIFNIIQLVGWTAIMIIQCVKSMAPITERLFGSGNFVWISLFIGVVVGLWALWSDKGLSLVNNIAVALLVGLSIFMVVFVLKHGQLKPVQESISIGLAFELSIIMPLSWVPLISDYTMRAKSPKGSFFGSFLGYFIGSSFMYLTGLIAAMYTGNSDPTGILAGLNFGLIALLVILLSTITTAFLDVYSSVMSTLNLSDKFSKKTLILFFTAISTLLALIFPMESYQNFLQLIGSLFAPAFTIVLMDYFIFKRDYSKSPFHLLAILTSFSGTAIYYLIQSWDMVLGSSIPSMLATAMIYSLVYFINKKRTREGNENVKSNC